MRKPNMPGIQPIVHFSLFINFLIFGKADLAIFLYFRKKRDGFHFHKVFGSCQG